MNKSAQRIGKPSLTIHAEPVTLKTLQLRSGGPPCVYLSTHCGPFIQASCRTRCSKLRKRIWTKGDHLGHLSHLGLFASRDMDGRAHAAEEAINSLAAFLYLVMGKVINRKTIKAGDLVQVVEYSRQLPRDTKRQRAAKSRVSSEAQRRLNNKTAKGKLAFLLAANYAPGRDFFVTLTYSDSSLPESRKEAIADRKEYLKSVRLQRKRRGDVLKWVGAIENKSGSGRWHHHLVISAADPALDTDELRSLWPYGNVHISPLFDQDHRSDTWFDLARYLTKERPEDGDDETPVGARIFSCSRGLDHPQPHFEIVDSSDRAELPRNAEAIDGLPQGDVTTTVDGIPVVIRYLTYQIRRSRPLMNYTTE